MKINKKLVAVSLATVLACGTFAGCDLVTTDAQKDMQQVIAEVDISLGEDFAEGGKYAAYADCIGVSNVLKRDMVANFLSVGYQYVQNGNTYADTFDLIQESLVNRKMIIQYAMVYFFEKNKENATEYPYTPEGYLAAVAADEVHPETAGLAYFLTDEEKAKAEYDLKVVINNSIDSQEESIITAESGEYDTARTTPTGVGTANEDYYDPAYKIYTGKNSASDCGTYETVDGSTPTTRKKAYNSFLANLSTNDLLEKGEDVSDFTSLNYYYIELQSAYEDALISKLSDDYEKTAEATLTEEYVQDKYDETLNTQKELFADSTTFETALDSISDTNFILYAPNGNYGFVYNILLPFSTTQNHALSAFKGTEGQKFVYRAQLLEKVQATDQRGTWFTCEEDYSFNAADAGVSAYGGDYLFFEDNLSDVGDGTRYETLKNYYGRYAYNGTVEYSEEDGYTLKPDKIDIDKAIAELEGYLSFAGITATGSKANADYYTQTADSFYQADGSVDYSKFLYYTGKAEIGTFDANDVFVAGSKVNTAMSVVNEFSFAYNTDTAGLNSYLGYVVSAYDTDYVKEFEYAARAAIAGGVGTYTVAPSDYGWHIMYCTFSYSVQTPYAFDWNEIDVEGSFSNLYYEALKASTVEGYATSMQTQIVNSYATCVTVYEDRYADLSSLDTAS